MSTEEITDAIRQSRASARPIDAFDRRILGELVEDAEISYAELGQRVVEVNIPLLRERAQDILWLMNQIFADLVAGQGKSLRGVSALAERAALAHPWPGNVRELKNRLERAVALNLIGWISPQDLFPERLPIAGPSSQSSWSLADAREAAEKHQIAVTLAENEGQIGKSAEALGMSRTTLWEKMKRYGLAES